MFLVWLAAYCATASCQPLHMVLKKICLIIQTKSHIPCMKIWMLKHLERHWVRDKVHLEKQKQVYQADEEVSPQPIQLKTSGMINYWLYRKVEFEKVTRRKRVKSVEETRAHKLHSQRATSPRPKGHHWNQRRQNIGWYLIFVCKNMRGTSS